MYLNCKTFFSYRYGTFSTEELVTEGVETGATALALTNINNTSDWWDFYTFCSEKGIRPLLGAEIREGDDILYILIARNNEGLLAINRYLSFHLQQKKPFAEEQEWPGDVFVIYPWTETKRDLKDNEFYGIRP